MSAQASDTAAGGYGVLTDAATVRLERLLPGPIERVWAYLTESDKRAQWLSSGRTDLHVGGRVEHVFRYSELTPNDEAAPGKHADIAVEARAAGTITACEPPRLLRYTWSESPADPSEVQFELEPRGDDVLLVVTHRRLPSRDTLIDVAAGWHTHLDILADRLAGRQPAGFWARHTPLEEEYERRIPDAL